MALRSIIVILIIGLSGVYARDLGARRSFSQELPRLAEIPASIDDWRSEDYPLGETIANVLAADVTLQRRYSRSDGAEVWVFMAYFAEQKVNSQIHSPRHCVPGSGWTIVSLEQTTLSLSSGPQRAARMLIERNGQEHDLVYWFRTRNGTVTGEYSLKWNLVTCSLARKPTDAAFIRYSAPVDQAEARRELMGILEPSLDTVLGGLGLHR